MTKEQNPYTAKLTDLTFPDITKEGPINRSQLTTLVSGGK
jgi:hypothetical protein